VRNCTNVLHKCTRQYPHSPVNNECSWCDMTSINYVFFFLVSLYVCEYPLVGGTDLILCLHCGLLCVSGCDFTCGCLLQARDPVMIRTLWLLVWIISCLFNWWLLLWIVFSVDILKPCLGATLSLKQYCISAMQCVLALIRHVVFFTCCLLSPVHRLTS